jgi:hypothetical protein
LKPSPPTRYRSLWAQRSPREVRSALRLVGLRRTLKVREVACLRGCCPVRHILRLPIRTVVTTVAAGHGLASPSVALRAAACCAGGTWIPGSSCPIWLTAQAALTRP